MNIQALIFDFDGVLADSVEIKTEAFAKLFESFGEDVVCKVIEHHRNNGGMTRTKKIKYYFETFLKKPINENMLIEYCDKFSNIVVDSVINAAEIKGSTDFIKSSYNKIPCFLNSATPDTELLEIVEKRGLGKYFKEILGAGKSKSQNLEFILDKYQLDPLSCVFFGDALSDYSAAIMCNVHFIGILPDRHAPLIKEKPEIKWYHDFAEFKLRNIEV